MKNVLIIGVLRSGKSTLARMLCKKYNLNYIPQDAMVDAFEEIFPKCGVCHDNKGKEPFAPFLFSYIKHLVKGRWDYGARSAPDCRPFVIEGCHVGVASACKSIDRTKWKIVALGYPSLTPDQALRGIRENDAAHEWTREVKDVELRGWLADAIKESQRHRSECAKLKIEFIDTSFDRRKKFAAFVKKYK